jgi:hypothetical protein
MRCSMQLVSRRLSLAGLAVALLVVVPIVCAQESADNPIRVTPAAHAGYSVSNFHYHILPANTPAGQSALAAHKFGTPVPSNRPTASIASVPAPGFYPDDLVYFGGPVVKDMLSHSVYLNASSCGGVAKCWGNPEKFLSDLGKSTFIHVTDQYTGTSGTYGVGAHVFASLTMYTNVIDQSDLFGLVHDAASALGTPSGYGHEYHVFLPPGVDTCFDESTECYSPDNPSTFVFCAYHGSLTFSDIGHVLFSVQPNQNVPGCQAAPPDPNGILQDSTDSVLAHETIETITDPDIDAWISDSSLLSSGAEIADLCEPTGNSKAQFLDSIVTLNGVKYELQLMYSNHYHACSPR